MGEADSSFDPNINDRMDLKDEEICFKLEKTSTRTARQSMEIVQEIFTARLISWCGRNLKWSVRSDGLTFRDFFLWGI